MNVDNENNIASATSENLLTSVEEVDLSELLQSYAVTVGTTVGVGVFVTTPDLGRVNISSIGSTARLTFQNNSWELWNETLRMNRYYGSTKDKVFPLKIEINGVVIACTEGYNP